MDLGLKDKVVLITGSSRGIGKIIALSFLKEGANVVINGRDDNTLKKTYKEFSDVYSDKNISIYRGDLTVMNNISYCIDSVIKRFGKIDILVANIGTGKSKLGLLADHQEWERMFRLNLIGNINIVREIIPLMQKNGGGSIIFISSITGREVIGAPIPYSVAKSGLISASKNFSHILAKDNIRVNTVVPGNIIFEGGRWEEIIEENPDIIENYIKKNVPMQRFGKPEEVANAVLFLASDKASFITGTCMTVDGGETRSIL